MQERQSPFTIQFSNNYRGMFVLKIAISISIIYKCKNKGVKTGCSNIYVENAGVTQYKLTGNYTK